MRSRTPIVIYLKAFASLIFCGVFLEDCSRCDFEKEIESNEGLKGANQEAKERAMSGIREHTRSSLHLLRKRLLRSFGTIFSAIVAGALCVGYLTKSPIRNVLVPESLFALLSVISFSWATLGRLGWAGQTFGGDTVFEDLDNLIFTCLYWLGTFLAVLTVSS